MFKFSLVCIIVVLIIEKTQSLGLPQEWGISSLDNKSWKNMLAKEPVNKTNCVFFRNESLLSCVGSGDRAPSVECGAALNLTDLDEKVFHSFGIGLQFFGLNGVDLFSDMTNLQYHLYPRMKSDGLYLSHFITLEEKSSKLCLFSSEFEFHQAFGITVEKSDCFNELRAFFFRLNSYKSVKIGSYLKEKPQAVIVADLYIV